MAIVPPVNDCAGSRYLEYSKLPGTSNLYAIIKGQGLSSLKFRGQPYTNFTTATPVIGKVDYFVVYFDDSDLDAAGGINTIESDETFFLGIVNARGGTGTSGFISSYSYEFDILNPNTGLPTDYYVIDTIPDGDSLNHCLKIQSCQGPENIKTISAALGTVTIINDTCFHYVAPEGYWTIDTATLSTEEWAENNISGAYPNPATDKLNVDVSIDKVAQLEVRLLDMSGRVVKSVLQQTAKGMNNVSLDLGNIANGVYGVQILENNALIHTSKVNKQDK